MLARGGRFSSAWKPITMRDMWQTRKKTTVFFFRGDSIRVALVSDGVVERTQEFPLAADASLTEVFGEAVRLYGKRGKVICGEGLSYVFSLQLEKKSLNDTDFLRKLCAERFPEDIENLVWDYRILETRGSSVYIQVSGMRRDFSEKLAEAFERWDFFSECTVPESYALAQRFLGQGNVLLCQKQEDKVLFCHIGFGGVFASQLSSQPETDAVGFLGYVRLHALNMIEKVIYVDFKGKKDFFPFENGLEREYLKLPFGAVLGVCQLRSRLRRNADVLDLRVPRRKFSFREYFGKSIL